MNCVSFTGPYRRQNWSLPDSIIYYIAKNPSTSKLYQKLIQSCKYFFIKNSIIVLTCLHYTKNGWKICTKQCELKESDMRKFDLEKVSSKLWILNTFDLCYKKKIIPPSVISKIYRSQIKVCILSKQTITLKEFLFLASSAEYCCIFECTVKDDKDGSPLQLEDIVSHLTILQKLFADFVPNAPNISSKTVKELLKLSHFSNIKNLSLLNLPDLFDINTFFKYFEDTNDISLNLHFGNSISDAFKNQLDAYVIKILETPSTTYRTPLVAYSGHNVEKFDSLFKLFIKNNY